MTPSIRIPILALSALTAPFLLVAQPADLIVHNAKIATVDARFRVQQAMAVRGDKIIATGSNAGILKLRGPETKMLDAGGKTVLPGLMDSHVHAADASMYEFDHPIGDMETIADVLAYIRSRAAVVPKGEWIGVAQVFITRLREQRYPTRAELDQAAPDHAVIFSTGPDASLNSRALALNKITRDSKPPAGKPGKVEVDPVTGEPTGILRSYTNLITVRPQSKPVSAEDRMKRLKMMLADYNAIGITSIADRDTSASELEIYRELRKRNELTCRVFLNYHIEPNEPWDQVEAQIKKAFEDPLHQHDDLLWLRGVKAYLDGGMLTGSAFLREPWGISTIYSITDREYRGLRFIEPERLYQTVKLVLASDLQFTAHSVGDGAVHALIEAYERVNRESPVRNKRPCITHSNFMSPEAIERMAKTGIVADLQPAWLERDGATLRKHFGDPRLRFFQPYASLFKARVMVGGGSDHMQKIGSMRAINPYNPFFGMWIAMTRQPRWTDQPLHPEERITREQAIRLYTINNAFLVFAEHEKGSLEKDKFADFIVLQQDILTCPVDQVKSIEVAETYMGGKRVYPAN